MVSYAYDVRNLKVEQTKSGATTYYQYDQKGDLIWTDDGTTSTKYIEALGETWAEVRTLDSPPAGSTPQVYYHALDHEGSHQRSHRFQRATVVWDGEYEAFGGTGSANGTLDFTPSYTGKQYDADTGLYYYNARFYDPTSGAVLEQ